MSEQNCADVVLLRTAFVKLVTRQLQGQMTPTGAVCLARKVVAGVVHLALACEVTAGNVTSVVWQLLNPSLQQQLCSVS
jgi:hypothetical protein